MRKGNEEKTFTLPRVDYCFKKIFGDEKNQNILKDFLCSILKLEKNEIRIIEIKNSEITKESISDPASRMDLLVKINKNETVDIEIHVQLHSAMPRRIMKYWAQNFIGTLESRMKNMNIKPCISIWILNDYMYEEIDNAHMIFEVIENKTGLKLAELLQIHIIELPKIDNEAYIQTEDKKLLEWLRFLKLESEREAEKMRENVTNSEIGKAIDILKIFSYDEKSRMEYLNRVSAIGDYETDIFEANRTGMEKGLELGKREGVELGKREGLEIMEENKRRIAKSLISTGMKTEKISEVTGLTIDEVKKLI